jgi:hypothetical protein
MGQARVKCYGVSGLEGEFFEYDLDAEDTLKHHPVLSPRVPDESTVFCRGRTRCVNVLAEVEAVLGSRKEQLSGHAGSHVDTAALFASD